MDTVFQKRMRLAKEFYLNVRCNLMCVPEEEIEDELSEQEAASVPRNALKKESEMIPTKHLILNFGGHCDPKN
ncbi:hypothetical protein CEXT_732681 [Caerostris extrusa]|uniref:Uncharacterized protein n=1 Tax=Caerostris extrusa TaxID=172846 RepID=A0AAV4R1F4_CAEEX|nr:hypothetical protein CEXT_732681 [Caerostris extrusa]